MTKPQLPKADLELDVAELGPPPRGFGEVAPEPSAKAEVGVWDLQ